MKQWYIYGAEGGPYSLGEIQAKIKSGLLYADCYVRRADQEDWVSLALAAPHLSEGGNVEPSKNDVEQPGVTVQTGIPDVECTGYEGAARKRYAQAYQVAGAMTTTGQLVKAIGVTVFFLGFLSGAVGLFSASVVSVTLGGSLVAIGIALFVSGLLLTAQGQLVCAALDTALNTSPLLTLNEKASIIFNVGR